MSEPNFMVTRYVSWGIEDAWALVHSLLGGFWKMAEEQAIFRRASLVAMWVITFQSYYWCFKAAEAAGYDPLAVAASFAVLTPVSGLQAAIMKFYGDSRKVAPLTK